MSALCSSTTVWNGLPLLGINLQGTSSLLLKSLVPGPLLSCYRVRGWSLYCVHMQVEEEFVSKYLFQQVQSFGFISFHMLPSS